MAEKNSSSKTIKDLVAGTAGGIMQVKSSALLYPPNRACFDDDSNGGALSNDLGAGRSTV